MARTRTGGSHGVIWILSLPIVLLWRATQMALRLLWSLHLFRVLALATAVALLVLAMEGAAVWRYGPRSHARFEAVLAATYALTLVGLGWGWWRFARRRRLR